MGGTQSKTGLFITIYSSNVYARRFGRIAAPREPQVKSQTASSKELKRRMAYADRHFRTANSLGSLTDRGKVYTALGHPDHLKQFKKSQFPLEVWTYGHIPGIGTNIRIEFMDATFNFEYKMVPPPGDEALEHKKLELIQERIRQVIGPGEKVPKNQ